MTDDLDQLRKALMAAPPAPDAGARADAKRLAMENFDRHQESAKAPRPMSDRPQRAGILTGVAKMLTTLTTRGALAATASLAAIGIGVMIWPTLQRDIAGPQPAPAVIGQAEAPKDLRKEVDGRSVAADSLTRADAPPAATAPAIPASEEVPLAEPRIEPLALARDQAVSGAVADTTAPSQAPRQKTAAAPGSVALPEAEFADLYQPNPEPNTEAFATTATNPVRIVAEDPVSTFSIDVDTASYSIVRSSLTRGYLPPAEAVRIEEMVNYFPYAYPAPAAGEAPFRPTVSVMPTPWNAGTELVHIAIQGRLPDLAERPPLDLVFLIDTSGSMDDPQKLPLLKQSLRLMLGELRPEDRVAIVTYAGSAGLVLEPTGAGDRASILAALDRLGAGGATAGADGLRQAYQVAESMEGDGRTRRILLATDGDFNVGIADPEELRGFIAKKRDSGTYLSVLGFGRGNLDDATMQALAQNGNGTAAYIDTLSEAQKVLVDQLSGALFAIANDVKIQIEFNPAAVAEYRLIGYETRALAREDFNNDKVDAGEIGAGHTVTALYEITRVGSPARLSDPLRYGQPVLTDDAGELGFLKLRYKKPGSDTSVLMEAPITTQTGEPGADQRFAAAIAGFGQLLSDPKYLGQWGWDEAIALANEARGTDPFGYRAEAVQLMRLAESLSH